MAYVTLVQAPSALSHKQRLVAHRHRSWIQHISRYLDIEAKALESAGTFIDQDVNAQAFMPPFRFYLHVLDSHSYFCRNHTHQF